MDRHRTVSLQTLKMAWICLAVFCFIIGHVQCYSMGAPFPTCLTMFPKHKGTQKQPTATMPFGIVVVGLDYRPFQEITVLLESHSPVRKFKGLQIRARPRYGDTERIVGEFTEHPPNKTQVYDCLGGKRNLVTHRNGDPVTKVALKWRAPAESVGDVVFVASIVEDFYTFWVNVTAILSSFIPVTVPTVGEVNPRVYGMDWNGCGDKKGCFLYPRTCSGANCYAAVTYRALNDTAFEFEMMSNTRAEYLSMGFSEDRVMGDDDTVTCTVQDALVSFQRGFNHMELFNERQFKAGISNMQAQLKDGKLLCRFTRPVTMAVYTDKGQGHMNNRMFDLKNNYYIMLAWGPVYDGTEIMGYHKELPPITDRMVDFRKHEIHRGSSLPLLKQIHGSLMLVAWILFVGIGTVIARYYKKKGCYGDTCCYSKLWFQIHRVVQLSAWLFTATSFVLIFVLIDGFTTRGKIHAYLGIAVMAASTLQVLAGLFRPGLESRFRPAFKWFHWVFGESVHLLAAVTFFFAFNTDFTVAPQRKFAIITLGVWVGIQLLWKIVFDCCARRNAKRQSKTLQPARDKEFQISEEEEQYNTSGCPNILLILYVMSLVVMVTACLLAVYLF